MYYYLLLINTFTLIYFGYDKWLARNHQRRIPENVLLSVTLIGGTIGDILGMITFRHKISKKSFLLKFGANIFLQAMIVYFLCINNIIEI